jgi:hypothetical protein
MEYKKEIEAMLFTRLFSMNNPYLDFNMSNFSIFNNSSTEKGDTNSKAGSGRVGLFLSSCLTHIYTFEAHY